MPHTEAIAACTDPEVLGRTFYLMGYVDGWSPMGTDGWPAPFDADVASRQGLAYELVDGIALLSKVDWRAKGLDDLGRPDGFHERQVDRWTSFLERIKGRDLPGFDVAAAWLRAHRPLDYVPGIMHGDYQFANVMFHHGAPARLAAIVDWEMGTVGDPKLDLAWVVQGWPADTSAPGDAFASYVDMTGMPSRAAIVDRYAKVSGRQVDDIDYYVVLAKWKLAVVLEQGFQRAGADEKLPGVRPHRARSHAGRGGAGRDHGLPLVSDPVTEPETELVSERRGAVCVLRLNRPEARNALTPRLISALGAAVLEADADPEIRAVVLTGSGTRSFCAGMDLRSFAAGDEFPGSDDDGAASGFMRLVQGEVATPLVGAANGTAVAGGFELLLGCDVVVASSEARFGLPEVKRGLFAAGGGTLIGTRIPLAVALEIALTGDTIDATARVRARPREQRRGARRRARLGNGPRGAHRRQRPAGRGGVQGAGAAGRFAFVTRARTRLEHWQQIVFASEDAKEGALAFVEKRPPVWTGR